MECTICVSDTEILNQFGRRNLSNYQRSVLALELEGLFKEKAKESKSKKVSHYRNTGEVLVNSPKPDTRKELSKVVRYLTRLTLRKTTSQKSD